MMKSDRNASRYRNVHIGDDEGSDTDAGDILDERDYLQTPSRSKETREKWLGLVPKGLGYLELKHPETYDNLPTRLAAFEDQFVVTTSMTHQLHSLSVCYGGSLLGPHIRCEQSAKGNALAPNPLLRLYTTRNHVLRRRPHSKDSQTTFPEGFEGSDGWDAQHVCKDYDQMLAYLNANRANDEIWV